MPALIRDLILAAYRGFTSPVYRMTAATDVALLPARAKPPQILAAEIAAAAAFVLTLVALLTRRALPPAGLDARRRVVILRIYRGGQLASEQTIDGFSAEMSIDLKPRRVIDTTAIEVA